MPVKPPVTQIKKVFCFFFSKKKPFLNNTAPTNKEPSLNPASITQRSRFG